MLAKELLLLNDRKPNKNVRLNLKLERITSQ